MLSGLQTCISLKFTSMQIRREYVLEEKCRALVPPARECSKSRSGLHVEEHAGEQEQ